LLHKFGARRVTFGDGARIAIAHKLRWARQIAPKLEPGLIDLRKRSQRFQGFPQE